MLDHPNDIRCRSPSWLMSLRGFDPSVLPDHCFRGYVYSCYPVCRLLSKLQLGRAGVLFFRLPLKGLSSANLYSESHVLCVDLVSYVVWWDYHKRLAEVSPDVRLSCLYLCHIGRDLRKGVQLAKP